MEHTRRSPVKPSNEPFDIERIHPGLRGKFTLLPDASDDLTDEQLAEIFGGNYKALGDIVRLIQQEI